MCAVVSHHGRFAFYGLVYAHGLTSAREEV
jgi:hypothetical protein